MNLVSTSRNVVSRLVSAGFVAALVPRLSAGDAMVSMATGWNLARSLASASAQATPRRNHSGVAAARRAKKQRKAARGRRR